MASEETWKDQLARPDYGKKKSQFQSALLSWFQDNGRDLPWRKIRDPYAILVSELMLQQTQVSRVIEYYHRFLEKFPDFETLAKAPESDILGLWEGLGYYNRARNFHKLAKQIMDEYSGKFPKDPEKILALPGIGKYTAGAVMTFALGIRAPINDTNVNRVISRVFLDGVQFSRPSEKSKIVWLLAEDLLPERDFWAFNQGIMDFGALQCVPKNPKCSSCPMRSFCQYHARHGLDRFF